MICFIKCFHTVRISMCAYVSLIACLLLSGCAVHKPAADRANRVPAKCIRLECREEDGCWYDRKAQVVHHQRVDVVCLDVSR